MRIQHNIMAMNAYRNYNNNTKALSKNLEKLSSGYKINRAGDDAAGLAISEKMRAQITGLDAAQKNVKDGTSLVNTAEGAMQEIHDMLNRMTYLATQSANGTYDNEVDRLNLQKEVESLKTEINRIADSANFNGIKLLDGVSGSGRLSELPIEYNTVSSTAGITLGDVKDGGGSPGVYTISIDKMFTWGDKIKVDGVGADGNALTSTLTMAESGANTFKGGSIEEQAESIADALTGAFGGNFDVRAEDNKVILTAKKDGTEKVGTVTSAKINGTDADVGAATAADTLKETQAAVAAGTGASSVRVLNMFGNASAADGAAANLEKGDKVTLAFKGADGKLLTHTFTVTDAMADPDANKAMAAIVEYLNSDEAVFDDNNVKEEEAVKIGTTPYSRENTTGIDESQMKLTDLFTIAAADLNGNLKITSKVAGVADTLGMVVDREGTKTSFGPDTAHGDDTAPGTAAAGAKAQVVTLDVTTNNFTNGDKIKLAGTMADGRTFEVELVAGKDFEVDSSSTAATAKERTLKNLKDALMSDKTILTLKDKDGNAAGTVKGSDFFGDGTETDTVPEFNVAVAGTKLTFTATRAGTVANHEASGITISDTTSKVTPLPDAKISLEKTPGSAKTAAQSSFTFDDKLTYGAAIRIGDNTYEIVKDAGDVTNRKNTAIVVDDPTDSKAVAKAVAEAIGKNEPNYTAKYVDNTVTVSSNEVGKEQKALSLSTPYGDKITTASFKFDPKVVKENSKLEFNGYTYEFVKKGGSVKNKDAIAIELDDPAKASAKELGDAFANVIKAGSATVAEDGTVTLKGVEAEDGTISDPQITFDNNLVLQIGDTADDFNQLTVKLSDMHTTAMGIDGIDIGKQETAQAAIDVIRDAINYVSSVRGDFGAISNRLDHTANNLSVMQENIQDAESTIRDTDVAAEMMAYTKNNILVQSAQAMLAQANQVPQGVLQLLQ